MMQRLWRRSESAPRELTRAETELAKMAEQLLALTDRDIGAWRATDREGLTLVLQSNPSIRLSPLPQQGYGHPELLTVVADDGDEHRLTADVAPIVRELYKAAREGIDLEREAWLNQIIVALGGSPAVRTSMESSQSTSDLWRVRGALEELGALLVDATNDDRQRWMGPKEEITSYRNGSYLSVLSDGNSTEVTVRVNGAAIYLGVSTPWGEATLYHHESGKLYGSKSDVPAQLCASVHEQRSRGSLSALQEVMRPAAADSAPVQSPASQLDADFAATANAKEPLLRVLASVQAEIFRFNEQGWGDSEELAEIVEDALCHADSAAAEGDIPGNSEVMRSVNAACSALLDAALRVHVNGVDDPNALRSMAEGLDQLDTAIDLLG